MCVQRKMSVIEVRLFKNFLNSDEVTSSIATIPTVAISVVTGGERLKL